MDSPPPRIRGDSTGPLPDAPPDDSLPIARGPSSGKQRSPPPPHNGMWRRIWALHRILVPSWRSLESGQICALVGLHVLRTWLSIQIATQMGHNAKWLAMREKGKFARGVAKVAAIFIPASLINGWTKYLTDTLGMSFRKRLSEHLYSKYFSGHTFYRAQFDCPIDNLEARLTKDVDMLCTTWSSLFSETLRPLLDIILFTRALSSELGFLAPVLIHSYFVVTALALRKLMKKMASIAREKEMLEGDLRYCHARLIHNAEEIALSGGQKREHWIVNNRFTRLMQHSQRLTKQHWIVQLLDSFFIKYGATLVAYITVSIPAFKDMDRVALRNQHLSIRERWLANANQTETARASEITSTITGVYIRNTQILINLTRSIGEVFGLYKKLLQLGAHTFRVVELIELMENSLQQLKPNTHMLNTGVAMGSRDNDSADAMLDASSTDGTRGGDDEGVPPFDGARDEREDRARLESELAVSSMEEPFSEPALADGRMEEGHHFVLSGVTIVSPLGRLLVDDLSLSMPPGTRLLITGPNGCGKSSLFRVLCRLWPFCGGTIRTPPGDQKVTYLPQTPYLVIGTLRDQVIYPDGPEDMTAKGITDFDLARLLDQLGLSGLLRWGWERWGDWSEQLSGGEKQRLAMCRLLYHQPHVALLDEPSTSVSGEVVHLLYSALAARGTTVFTISHNRSMVRYHDHNLRLGGANGSWVLYRSRDGSIVSAHHSVARARHTSPTGEVHGGLMVAEDASREMEDVAVPLLSSDGDDEGHSTTEDDDEDEDSISTMMRGDGVEDEGSSYAHEEDMETM